MSAVETLKEIDEALLVALSREVAINIKPLSEILQAFSLSQKDWDRISHTPQFTALLSQHALEWESALNTHDRVKLKASAMIEDWLPEAHKRLHDHTETLSSKTELGKLITRLAGMGLDHVEGAGAGERLTVTINLGGDTRLKFDQPLPPKVIDAVD